MRPQVTAREVTYLNGLPTDDEVVLEERGESIYNDPGSMPVNIKQTKYYKSVRGKFRIANETAPRKGETEVYLTDEEINSLP